MTAVKVRRFAETFCDAENEVWRKVFTERDHRALRKIIRGLGRFYAGGIDIQIKRGRKPDSWFEEDAPGFLERVVKRELRGFRAAENEFVLYTSSAGRNGRAGTLSWRLSGRITGESLVIVGLCRACPTCGGVGHAAGSTCGECSGDRWKHTQGLQLDAESELSQAPFEVVSVPTDEVSLPLFAHLESGGL